MFSPQPSNIVEKIKRPVRCTNIHISFSIGLCVKECLRIEEICLTGELIKFITKTMIFINNKDVERDHGHLKKINFLLSMLLQMGKEDGALLLSVQVNYFDFTMATYIFSFYVHVTHLIFIVALSKARMTINKRQVGRSYIWGIVDLMKLLMIIHV